MSKTPDPKPGRRKGVIQRGLEQALEAAETATDVARDVAGMAREVARQATSSLADSAGDMISTTGEAALRLAQGYLGQRSITLPLPEPLLNHQIRQRLDGRGGIDHLTIDCGDDTLHLLVDGHFQRLVYTVELHFAVTECRVAPEERSLRLQQVSEGLDVQLRQTNMVVNWAARQASRQAFRLANKLPLPSLANHVIKDIPGIHAEGHRRWRIDLDEAGLIDVIESPSWMLDKLMELTDFSLLPGLSVLRDSHELLQRLVDQFEVRGLRVQPGRLEVSVGIGSAG
ncbi:MAG: hypothetical protein VW625_08600 [Perlucidibaca sp.]